MPDVSGHAQTTTGPGQQAVVTTLPAEIDITNCVLICEAIGRALRSRPAVLIADATRTTFCDCAGVRELIRAGRTAAAAGTELRVAASPALSRMLRLTGAGHLLSTYPTANAASASAEKAR